MIQHLTSQRQRSAPLSIIFTGDVVLDVPDPDHWLAGIAPALQQADLVIGHLEVPHTNALHEMSGDVPAPGADPDHLKALPRAGFDAMTLAGNHMADCGAEGIADTRAVLATLGIAHAGAGASLAEARAPMVLECADGRSVRVLSYNCVGPERGWATDDRAGCAYLGVMTSDGGPVRPASTLTMPSAEAIRWLREDIAALKHPDALVVVALHKGTVHTPVRVEVYERLLAAAAIDAGADIVIGHHAHLVRGIEFMQGKPVFHGLGNGCVVTRALSPDQAHPARAAWAGRRKQLFGFEPDPAFELAPFHPDAVFSFLGRVCWYADGALECGIIPVVVDAPGRPRLAEGDEIKRVCEYVEYITARAGFKAPTLTVRPDMVVVE